MAPQSHSLPYVFSINSKINQQISSSIWETNGMSQRPNATAEEYVAARYS